ncbi:MAG TPA: ABC transporter substrate-binding protein [Rhizomicrobium sp.]|nr:ABC transporter substrate-binding protein [Rhizomicrobium sp.]
MAAPTSSTSGPQRIMSLKICTDELLMDLAPPSRIASVTFLSREKAALKLWPQAARIPVNHNSPEEVLATRPDLILTDSFTSPEMRALLARSGARVVEVPPAENFDQIRTVARLVGDAVGEPAKAEAMIAQMDATLRMLAATKPPRPIRVMGWGGGGFVPGRSTLFNAVLEAAGGSDIADVDRYTDVEGLIAAKPDVLAYGDDYIDTPSLRMDQNAHPLLLKFYGNRRIVYPAAYLNCGLSESAMAAAMLRRQLQTAMAKPGGVP